jgi:titin
VRVSWTDNATNEGEYAVLRCEGVGCGIFTQLAIGLPAGTTSYVDSSVVLGTTYTYRVAAINPIANVQSASSAAITPFLANDASGLAASTASATQVNLSWTDNAFNETGYEVLRCEGVGCVAYAVIGTVAANATAFADGTVAEGNDYRYFVRALSGFGASGGSNVATANTRFPAAPSGLVATTLSNSSIRLTWTDNADNETQFSIVRCAGAGCTITAPPIAFVPTGTTEYTDTGLSTDEEYTYRVSAVNSVGVSPPSGSATATTNLPAVPGPISAAVQNSGTSVYLNFTRVANATGYSIQRCEGAGCTDFAEVTEVPEDGSTNFYVDLGLTGGATYRYRVAAVNAAGASAFTNEIRITVGPPATPTGFTATLRNLFADLRWTDASDNEQTFELQRCTGVGCTDFVYIANASTNADSAVDAGIAVGNHYRYILRTNNQAGNSAFTAPVDLPVFLPETPTNFDAQTFSATQVNLSWTDGGTNELGFIIERCQNTGCTNFAVRDTVPANTVTYADAGLPQNQTFRYRLRSFNAIGLSAYTAVDSAETNVPLAPDSLTAVALAADEILLTWADQSNNETQFVLEFCDGPGCVDFGFLALLPANIESFNHTGLVAGEFYSYRLQALGSAGSSPFTAIATTDTDAPTVVTGLSATTLGPTLVSLAWTDNSTNELGYVVERCAGACGAYTTLDTLPRNATGFSDATVTVDESYQYRIAAFNNVGSVTSGTAAANTLRPAAPTNFRAATVSSTQVDVAWTDASGNETQFVLERCVGAGCSTFTTLATLGAGDSTYQDLDVLASESYSYRLRAANIAGASAEVGPVTVTTFVPAAPATVTAVAASPTSITVSWTDLADNELGYRIERCAGASCSNYAEVGSVGPGVTTFTSTGLTAGLFYRHRVRAFNNAGTSAFVTPATDPTGIFPPTAATALAATTLSATEVRLSWNDLAANESGFRIERCAGAGCTNFAEVATAPATLPSGASVFVDNAAPAGVVLRYRVLAFNGVGVASATNTAQASTTVPNAPTALTATANGQTLAQMSWQDQSADETGFVIERCLGAGCTDFAPLDTVAAGVTTFDDGSVTGGNIYLYRVYAIGNGRSASSGAATVSTILPPAPTALVAVPISNTIVALTWSESATDETGFVVSRCAGVGCSNFVDIFTTAAGATSYEDTSAPAGESLTYQVRAVNPAGPSAASNAQTVGTFIPAIPTTLSAALVSATQIDLSWANPATDELGVIVERCEGAGCSSFAVIDTTVADATTYSDASALAGVTYRYRVRAFNGAGSSGNTSAVTISTTVPDAPTGLMLNRPQTNSGAVGLAWTDVSNTETGYVVERCDGTGCTTFAQIATLGADATAYNDAGISLDTTYVYQVRAENVVGFSVPATFSVRTYRPAIATGLSATTVSATRIDLAWSVPDSGASEATAVEFCQGAGCSGFVLLDSVPNDASTFTADGLNPGVTYRYRIVRENLFGTLGESVVAEASTDIPVVPSGTAATTVSGSEIAVTWVDASLNESAFLIERCDTDPCTGAWVELDSTLAGVDTYNDTTVSVGVAYSYRVRARNGAGTSDPSPVATANTFLPDAPTLSTVRVTSSSSVDLEWTAANFTASYIVERCTLPSCTFEAIDTVAALTVSDPTVEYGRSYEYRVRGLNVVGTGNSSATLAAEILEPVAPGAPVIEAVSPTEVRIAWADNSNNEERFAIERCEGVGCGDFALVDTVSANETGYLDGGLATGSKYEYRIFAINAVGASAPSPSTLIVMQEPGVPQNLAALTTGPGQITVEWQDNSDNEIQFLLERCVGLTCTDFVQIVALPAGTQQYVDNGLSLNAVYRYRVRAINGVGLSDFSNIDNANTVLPPPASGLTATINSGARVTLNWTDNSPNESGFRIERCAGAGCVNFAEVAQVSENVTTFSNTGLAYGQTYSWRVRAANISGDAAPTNTATADLTLTQPAITLANPTTRTAVDLEWSNSSGWQVGFQVFRCQGEGCDPLAGAPLGTVTGSTFTFADNVPLPGFEYNYAVRAVTVNGASLPSPVTAVRTPIELQNATFVTGISDGTQGGWRRYAFDVPADALAMRVLMGQGGGDSDLYVKYDAVPTVRGSTLRTATECVPWESGTQDEICDFTSPAAGTWYVSLFAFSPYFNNAVKLSLAERFGYTDLSGVANIPGDIVVAHRVVVTEPTSVTHLGVGIFGLGTTSAARIGLYSSRAAGDLNPTEPLEPDQLLAEIDIPATATGLNEVALASEIVIQPGVYFLASQANTGSVQWASDGVPTFYRFVTPSPYVAGLPASWPALSNIQPSFARNSVFFRGFR